MVINILSIIVIDICLLGGDQDVFTQWSLALLFVINGFLYVVLGNVYKITIYVVISLVTNTSSFGYNYVSYSRDELHMMTDH